MVTLFFQNLNNPFLFLQKVEEIMLSLDQHRTLNRNIKITEVDFNCTGRCYKKINKKTRRTNKYIRLAQHDRVEYSQEIKLRTRIVRRL